MYFLICDFFFDGILNVIIVNHVEEYVVMEIFEFTDTTLDEYKGVDLYPAFMQIGDECFELVSKASQKNSAWPIFQKIFYNRFYGIKREYIDSLFEKRLVKNHNHPNGQLIFTKKFEKLLGSKKYKPCKFSNTGYVKAFKNNRDYLYLLRKVIRETRLSDFKLYLCKAEDIDLPEYMEIYKKLLEQYESKKKYKITKGNLIVGKINDEILTPREKLFSYIEKEYDSKILIGDIELDAEQEKILDEYMTEELAAFTNQYDFYEYDSYYSTIVSKKTFAYGLVRYAMENYNKNHAKDFWPYFKDKYGIRIPISQQKNIHFVFREILENTGKEDLISVDNGVDDITMHGFVSDHSSKQFFDYLFTFWRLDLGRNIESLSEESSCIDDLIDVIKNRPQNIMSHTAHLLDFPKIQPIFKNRVIRILKLMDDCFWNDEKCIESGNRINRLLNSWMEDANCLFVKEKTYKARNVLNRNKGAIAFKTPVLKLNNSSNTLKLLLPTQRLFKCDEKDRPCWMIKSGDGLFEKTIDTIDKSYKKDKIGFYVDDISIDIPLSLVLSEFRIELIQNINGNVLKSYTISSTDVRLFDADGRNIDYHNNIVKEGNLTAISKDRMFPYKFPYTSDSDFPTAFSDGFYLKYGRFQDGQIIIFPGNYGVQIGHKFHEGYDESGMIKGASLIGEDGQSYQICNTLPKVFFKAKADQIDGIALFTNGKPNKISDKVVGFRLDDDLENEGYALDISLFIKEDGLYEIYLSYPRMNRQTEVIHVAYLEDFAYEFVDAPYVFAEKAKLQFPAKLRFEEEGVKEYHDLWNYDQAWWKVFEFNFAEKNPDSDSYCGLVDDNKITLTYLSNNKKYKVRFDIPALLWKFHENDEYNVKAPADITLKELKHDKNRLYVSGPFDFNNMFIYTNDDVEIAEEESQLRIKDSKNPYFELEKVLNWVNNDISQSRISLSLSLDEKIKMKLVDIICRSKLKDVSLIGDFQNKILRGKVDIIGNEEYTITIYRDGELVCEDVRIENGEFTVETELKSGIYESDVYEISDDEDDDFDMDSSAIRLNKEPIRCELINLSDLEGKLVQIRGYRDIEDKYNGVIFMKGYELHNLHRVQYSQLIAEGYEILGIWDDRFAEKEVREKMVWYKAKLSSRTINISIPVLVTFKDLNDMRSMVIMEIVDSECTELTVNTEDRKIVSQDRLEQYYKGRRKLDCKIIYDVESYWIAQIK